MTKRMWILATFAIDPDPVERLDISVSDLHDLKTATARTPIGEMAHVRSVGKNFILHEVHASVQPDGVTMIAGSLGWITVIRREAETEVLHFADERDARDYFDHAKLQWSDSYLMEVAEGPRDSVPLGPFTSIPESPSRGLEIAKAIFGIPPKITSGQRRLLTELLAGPLTLPSEHPKFGLFVGLIAMNLVDHKHDGDTTTVSINGVGRWALAAWGG